MKKIVLSLLLACSVLIVRSQIAVSYFPFQSLLALSSNTERLLWADFKLETNAFGSNINMELAPMWNVKRSDLVNYYLGPGINLFPAYANSDLSVLSGYFITMGTRIKPFEKYKGVQLVFELSPYVNSLLTNGGIRTRLGLAYNFTRKKNS
jgi:hypothetical protein